MKPSSIAYPLLLVLLVTALPSCAGFGSRRAKVTPQRPRIGFTTQTTEFGTFEVEGGVQTDPSDNFSVPIRTKIGVSPTAELLVEVSPYSYQDDPGPDPSGISPLTVVFRQRLMNESKAYPATSFHLGTRLPVGNDDFGSGFNDFIMGFSADRTFNNVLATAFYQVGLQGTKMSGDLNVEHSASLAMTLPLTERVFGLAELHALYDVELIEGGGPVVLNLAGIYDFTDTLVLDAGIRLGLNEDAEDVVLQVGFTTNLGILF